MTALHVTGLLNSRTLSILLYQSWCCYLQRWFPPLVQFHWIQVFSCVQVFFIFCDIISHNSSLGQYFTKPPLAVKPVVFLLGCVPINWMLKFLSHSSWQNCWSSVRRAGYDDMMVNDFNSNSNTFSFFKPFECSYENMLERCHFETWISDWKIQRNSRQTGKPLLSSELTYAFLTWSLTFAIWLSLGSLMTVQY